MLAIAFIILAYMGFFSAPMTFLTYGPAYGLCALIFMAFHASLKANLWRLATVTFSSCVGSGTRGR